MHCLARLLQYLLVLLLLTAGPAARADICRVATDGVAINSGSNWALATTLKDALANTYGKNCSDIWVKHGVYKPIAGPANTSADREIGFAINRQLRLFGGFAGTEILFVDRTLATIAANPTVLSGDIDSNDTDNDGNQIDENFDDIQGSNSFHVVIIGGGTSSDGNGVYTSAGTIIDGFIIAGGDARTASLLSGGGMVCNGRGVGKVCSPSIVNVTFSGNQAGYGGALYDLAYAGNSNPSLTNVTFSRNHADHSGGAMFNEGNSGNSSPVLTAVTFNNNGAATNGGAVMNNGYNAGKSSPTLTNVSFSGNFATNGGAMYNDGNIGTSSPTLTNVTFSGNNASQHGGALYNNGPAGSISSPTLNNVILAHNVASSEPEIFDQVNATATLNHSILYDTQSLGCPSGATCDAYTLFADPKLGALADNGGATKTMLPAAGSAAFDTGDDVTCPATDQRGVPRPQNRRCDIGAIEIARTSSVCRVWSAATVGTDDGTSWSNAFVDLQSALHDAGCMEIWVAKGVYKPTTGLNPSISFVINRPLKLHGGFAGTENALGDRTPVTIAANRTVLSGDIDNNDANSDGNQVDEKPTDIQGTNTYHIMVIGGTDDTGNGVYTPANTLIDGFTITGGFANGTDAGGIYCNGSGPNAACSPTISNVVFSGNSANYGGALFNAGAPDGTSSPMLIDITFSGNHASMSGGAIYNYGESTGTSNPTLSNVTFAYNSANYGGAMFNDGLGGISNPTLNNVTFGGNTASIVGGAICNDGVYYGDVNLILNNVILFDDAAATGPEIGSLQSGGVTTLNHGIVYNTGTMSGACPANTTCTNTLFADPKLGALAGNGGTTQTMLPGAGSAAIDAGDDGMDICPATDQRGVIRPQGAHCDIGAVEVIFVADRIFASGFEAAPAP